MNDPQPASPLLGWVRPAQWLLIDTLAGLGYGLLAFVALANGASSAGGWLAACVGTVCLAGPVTVRRSGPLVSLAVLLATIEVMAAFAPSTTVMALPPLVLVLYTVATETRLPIAAGALMVACAAVFATCLPHLLHPGGIIVAVPVFVAAWALGAVFGLHRRHLRMQLELQERLRRAHERQAELELVDQRVRIARELHDVVAHGMSVITVQAGFAGLVSDDPEVVRSALGSIETIGRQTLNEMRTLLEVLRDGAEPNEPTVLPVPRLDDLDALIERIREAGVDVGLTRRGPTTALPPLVELNAYRIVQEALTNVIKHAGPVRATVHLARDDSELTITIRDDGPPTPGGSVEPGHGITGMLERARILGGTLRAGPLPGGGYEVVGQVPTSDRRATPRRLAAGPV
jgi:signal transduction histidine kinase